MGDRGGDSAGGYSGGVTYLHQSIDFHPPFLPLRYTTNESFFMVNFLFAPPDKRQRAAPDSRSGAALWLFLRLEPPIRSISPARQSLVCLGCGFHRSICIDHFHPGVW